MWFGILSLTDLSMDLSPILPIFYQEVIVLWNILLFYGQKLRFFADSYDWFLGGYPPCKNVYKLFNKKRQVELQCWQILLLWTLLPLGGISISQTHLLMKKTLIKTKDTRCFFLQISMTILRARVQIHHWFYFTMFTINIPLFVVTVFNLFSSQTFSMCSCLLICIAVNFVFYLLVRTRIKCTNLHWLTSVWELQNTMYKLFNLQECFIYLHSRFQYNCVVYCGNNMPYLNYELSGFAFSHLPRCGKLLRQKDRKKLYMKYCVQGFLRFSDSNKPRQSVSLIYELA